MNIKADVIVLYARPYEVVDEKTGVKNTGVSIQYLMTDNMLPVYSEYDKGIKSNRGSLPVEVNQKINHLPGIYEATFDMKTNSNGKPELAVTDLIFKGYIESKLVTDSNNLNTF